MRETYFHCKCYNVYKYEWSFSRSWQVTASVLGTSLSQLCHFPNPVTKQQRGVERWKKKLHLLTNSYQDTNFRRENYYVVCRRTPLSSTKPSPYTTWDLRTGTPSDWLTIHGTRSYPWVRQFSWTTFPGYALEEVRGPRLHSSVNTVICHVVRTVLLFQVVGVCSTRKSTVPISLVTFKQLHCWTFSYEFLFSVRHPSFLVFFFRCYHELLKEPHKTGKTSRQKGGPGGRSDPMEDNSLTQGLRQ